MVADAEISPGEATRQASLDHVALKLPSDPAAAPVAPVAPVAPTLGNTPMPTLEQFLQKQESQHAAAHRTDDSFLQMNASTADLEDLLGALTAAVPPQQPQLSAMSAPSPKPLDAAAAASADSLHWAPTDDRQLLGLSFLQLKREESVEEQLADGVLVTVADAAGDSAAAALETALQGAAGLLRRAAAYKDGGTAALARLADRLEDPAVEDPAALLREVAAGFCTGAVPAGGQPRAAPAAPAFLLAARKQGAAWAALAERARAWSAASHTGEVNTDALIDDFVAETEAEAAWVKETATPVVPPPPPPVACRVTPASTAVAAALLVLQQPADTAAAER